MTIEHVAPENPPNGVPPLPSAGAFGNLLLLDEVANNKVANKPFSEKKKAYQAASVPMDTTLISATAWSKTEIEARTKTLAKLAYDKVFKL